MAEQNLIELIKILRERTGAGMMDCKKALEENGLDVEKAVDYLREKGIAKQAKRASRTAAEGLTNVYICPKCGKAVILEVNCETDFVSSSDKFRVLVDNVTKALLEHEPKSLEEAKQLTEKDFTDAALAMGEKMELRRYAIVTKEATEAFASYIHMGGKISVLVTLDKANDELAKPLAMHIAANNPLYIELKDVPAGDRAREKAIAEAEVKDDPKLTGKPEAVKAQIVERKVDKVLSQSCLTLQPYLLDESKTVGQVLAEGGVKIVSFVRFQVGEGIVKDPNQAN
jgi:elongation factor Ts